MRSIVASQVLFALLSGALSSGQTPSKSPLNAPQVKSQIDAVLSKEYPKLDSLYKDIHAHPELGFQENATAAKLAEQMRALGFTVTEHVGKTGVVALLKNGDGPSVLVRTELDALPMEEHTGLPYASRAQTEWDGKETFVAHSCGHDIHMAAWVGAAEALVSLMPQWKGTLVFVAQPAEETVDGAKTMLDDGFIQKFGKPDYGFALHVGPGAAGQIYYKSGVVSSNSDSLKVTFHGRGGHGSMPSTTIDPVMMAGHFIVDVQSVISREKDPAAFGVVTIGSVQAGSAGNIIPDQAVLRGTIRTFSTEVRTKILSGVQRTAKAVAEMSDAPSPADVEIVEGGKAVVNDQALTERTAAVFQSAFGANAMAISQPGSASEDYSQFILAGIPSMYFAVGGFDPKLMQEAKDNGKPLPSNHSPFFAPIPEPTIKTAVEAMTLAVMNVLRT